MSEQDQDNNDLPRIGKDKQKREYKGVNVYLKYRPMTRDFEWAFYQQKTAKICGVEKSIDKCMKAAAKYIDHINPDAGKTL